ncbi:MAG: family 20 glycosylhydrolase [Spirochaetes bacterium]|nr:family 20 glycosylhydrolase [Spirochaetota bacterium]
MEHNKLNGIMLDVSRGQVPRIRTLRSLLSLLKDTPINFFSLYIEHTYQFRNHPLLWKKTGAYSKKEVRELVELADACGIEVIPSIQTLGHFPKLLKHKEYAGLSETSLYYSLSPALSSTYQLIEDLIEDICDAFPSSYINIGLDEIWDLGRDRSRPLSKKYGLDGLFLRHVLAVKKMVEKRGRRIMMWGDMLIKFPKILKKLPKDIVVLNWNYSYDDKRLRAFKRQIRLIGRSNVPQILCGGTSSWARLFPPLKGSMKNIAFIREEEKKVKMSKGAMITSWGDDGNFNLLGEALIGLLYFSYFPGRPKYSGLYAEVLKHLWEIKEKGKRDGLIKILDFFSRHNEDLSLLLEEPVDCYRIFWDISFLPGLRGSISRNIKKLRDYLSRAKGYYKELDRFKPIKKNQTFFQEVRLKIDHIIVLMERFILVFEINKKYREAFMNMGNVHLVNKNLTAFLHLLKEIMTRMKDLKAEYKALWKISYKGSGLEYHLFRYDQLISLYGSKLKEIKWIKDQYNKPGGGLIKKDILSGKPDDYYDVITPIPIPDDPDRC